MATIWATGVVVPVINGQGLGVRAAAGKKASAKRSPQKSERGFLDRLGEWMDKESFSETDPILKKREEEKSSPSTPPQKKGGFFGFS